ncbi:MAG: DNA-directed RNA polymerase subunit beta' [Candidatus Cloacimonadales bacterium]|jgi:DNA-directed RNA polymerase subunit beta'|nr:DNA-directed RNA polymerase subunit beta' [Candidatus Cloacimonadota bacterium]MDD2650551.1 DNA-directed RNA polymerase subunit beta' [Candidatus Cloacimonadota bacterium]MDX9977759.1 DNA-directed RNA polymerase subunit beta' [Candidatus Cloacimonadales bacterium]
MSTDNKIPKRSSSYDAVRIRVASPEKIRSWSRGEVTKPETLNYRSLKPEKDGLFCEKIFGPEKDYECSCGKYKKRSTMTIVCDRCGVEVTSSRVRRSRMGHIELAVPVTHIWFVKSAPSKIGTLLDLTINKLERVLYYESYIVLDPGESDYERLDLIDSDEYYEIIDKVGPNFKAKMGAEAVRDLLENLNMDNEADKIKAPLANETSALRKQKLIRKLKVVEAFIRSGNRPEWMVLEVLPVLPPTLRPLVALEGGRFATADFNDLYRRVISRNNRLKQLIEIHAPEVILRNEKRMLQEAVDALIDNQSKTRPVKGRGNRPLKSLTDQLKGKQGRFRQNLLGKRVDYSGRSVITVGPHLKLHQCGLPKDMAIELFKPFIIEKLEKYGEIDKTKSAKKMVEKKQPQIWKILEEVIEDYPVLLNRAPTLHRLGIQAFMPILTENKAIELHPMVCSPFNADFDGDQMAVHVPLSYEAQMEARTLMLSSRNLLLPANGKLAMAASQDIVLGCFYLTNTKPQEPAPIEKLRYFSSFEEVILAYEREESLHSQKGQDAKERKLDLHTWIRIKIEEPETKVMDWHITTVGRVLFNNILPKELGFQNITFDKSKLNDLAMRSYKVVGQARTAILLDDIKDLGFKFATKAGITFSFSDIVVPEKKNEIIEATELQVKEIDDIYQNGGITENERSSRIIDKWKMATEQVTDALMEELVKDKEGFNSIYMMYLSGARGGKDQIKQLGGMRGLMAKPAKSTSSGEAEIIESPIKSNFKEGLTVLQYFISTHGARKGLADTALKTADAGYLTRRLVDVAQNAIITSEDCGTIEGLTVTPLKEGLETVQSIKDRIEGRFAAEDVKDPITDKIIVYANGYINEEKASIIQQRGIFAVKIRSVLTCEEVKGLCVKCYGKNLSNNKLSNIGEPVGIIAAQSIGEPGTQLTLRTFHIGGTASTDVERAEVTSNYDGIVKFERMNYVINKHDELISVSHLGRIQILDEKNVVQEEYKVEYAAKIDVHDGQKIIKNTRLFSWDHYNNSLITTTGGKIKFENFQKDLTYKEEFNDLTGQKEITIIESKDRRIQAQIAVINEESGREERLLLPTGLVLEVDEGEHVEIGDILGKSTRITIKQRDITGGLPRVQDLFEAREPKDKALISFITGRVTIGDLTKSGRVIFVTAETGEGENEIQEKYIVPPGKRIIVHQGDLVESGDALSDGALDPHDILKAKGIKAAQFLILNEVQEVYRKQGVTIDDKHVSVIIRQMFNKVRISNPGYTTFLEGELVDKNAVIKENKRIETIEIKREGKVLSIDDKVAKFEQILLGITKASLLTESWLSAASFQETSRVLTEAAIEGKLDYLEGLKESIILGYRIPVGTGTRYYNEMVQKEIKNGKTIKEIIQMFAHSDEIDEHVESIEEVLDF